MGALDKTIYILHGWTTSTEKWQPFLAKLKEKGLDPVFLSIPGLTADIDHPWDINDYVEWLKSKLPPTKRIALLGHSNGGRIALAFALKYPDQIDKLFLIDSAGIFHDDIITKTKRGVFKTLAVVGKKLTDAEKARDFLYKLAQESDYRDAPPVVRETMKNLIAVNLLPRLQEIDIPTVIIWGKEDRVTPYTDGVIMRDGIKNSKFYEIKDAKHSPHVTNVEEVAKIIQDNI